MKLDLGCGPNPRDGFIGVDVRDYGRRDIIVVDLRGTWKWDDGSVDEVYCSHFVEHLETHERVHFANELHRVLRPGGRAEIIVPHWSSGRAYGDLTHRWPPVSEHWFLYLSREWRAENAPHTDIANCICLGREVCHCYSCDLVVQHGFRLHPEIVLRNQEHQQFAAAFYREACQDIVATFIKPEESE